MAIGVAVANAILLVTFAEKNRIGGAEPLAAAREAATERLRPVLMTSTAMIAGMIPMALAIGRGAEETAPLGRAVIGGLSTAATLATLFLLPSTIFGDCAAQSVYCVTFARSGKIPKALSSLLNRSPHDESRNS